MKQFILPGLGRDRTQARLITVSGWARTVPMSHRDKHVVAWRLCNLCSEPRRVTKVGSKKLQFLDRQRLISDREDMGWVLKISI